jgi:hypothetical protein
MRTKSGLRRRLHDKHHFFFSPVVNMTLYARNVSNRIATGSRSTSKDSYRSTTQCEFRRAEQEGIMFRHLTLSEPREREIPSDSQALTKQVERHMRQQTRTNTYFEYLDNNSTSIWVPVGNLRELTLSSACSSRRFFVHSCAVGVHSWFVDCSICSTRSHSHA